MSKASGPTNMANSHTTSVADLDLDGVPACHRHGVRALRARLSDIDGVRIQRIHNTVGNDTTIFLSVEDDCSDLLGTTEVRRALRDTGVERVALRLGSHFSIKLDYFYGFPV